MTLRICSHIHSPSHVVICPDCNMPYRACDTCGLGVCLYCAESMIRRKARYDRDQRRQRRRKTEDPKAYGG